MSDLVLKGSMFNGFEYFEKACVVVDQSTGIIKEAGTQDSVGVSTQANEISSDEITILPGLIDTHVHFFGMREDHSYDLVSVVTMPESLAALRSVEDAKNLLYAGFTTVRDLGSKAAISLSRAVAEGSIEGPRIIPAGKSIAQTGGNDDPLILPIDVSRELSYSYYCDGPWECRKTVRRILRDGAGVIKVYASGSFAQGGKIRVQLTVEELRAIVDEAHHGGVKVAAHAYGEEALSNVIEAGVDSIEHGVGLNSEIADRIRKKGIYYVPTLSAFIGSRYDSNSQRGAIVRTHLEKDVNLAKEFNLKIAMGTDFIGRKEKPHGQNYLEIVNLAKFFGNDTALIASTSTAADCLGIEDVGRIQSSMVADILVVRGNPRDNPEILNPRNVLYVIKNGKISTPNKSISASQ